MKGFQKNLEQREKSELIAIILQMLRQEPELQWLITTPLPTPSTAQVSLDPGVFRQQVQAAMEAGELRSQRKRHEVERRLRAIQAIADAFIKQCQYAAALTIYEVLVTEVIAQYNRYPDEYIALNVMLQGSVDGLDSCFAGKNNDPEIRLRVCKMLFAIYRFFAESGMDLDEDISGLLAENTTAEERQQVRGWVQDALSASKDQGSSRQRYGTLMAVLARADRK